MTSTAGAACKCFSVVDVQPALKSADVHYSGMAHARSDESTRLPPMWPGLDSQSRRHMWVEFVDSVLCTERFFSGYSGFPLSSKTKI